MTKVKSEWMCKEDESLYKLQSESKGQVGCSTGKPASGPITKTIHPSKQKKAVKATVSTLTSSAPPDWSESSTGSDSSDNSKDTPWNDENAE